MTQLQGGGFARRPRVGGARTVCIGLFVAGAIVACARATERTQRDAGDTSPQPTELSLTPSRASTPSLFGIAPETLPSPETTGFERGKTTDSAPRGLFCELLARSGRLFGGFSREEGIGVDAAGEVWRFRRTSVAEPRVITHLGHVKFDDMTLLRRSASEVGVRPLADLGAACDDCAGPVVRIYRQKDGNTQEVTVGVAGPIVKVDPSNGGQTILRFMLALWRDLR